MQRNLWKLILTMVLLISVLALGNVQAAEDSVDTENFKGLVLTTTVGSDQASVKLYNGYAQTSSKLMTRYIRSRQQTAAWPITMAWATRV